MKRTICNVICVQLLAGFTYAQDINFDSIAGTYNAIQSGYAGMNWNNLIELNAQNYSFNPSGYLNGNTSSPNVAFNAYGSPASFYSVGLTPFALTSAEFTAAWFNNLNLEVEGYLGGHLVYDQNFTLQETAPQDLQFGSVMVDTVNFFTSGGTPAPGVIGSGTQFALDDLIVNGSSVNGAPVPDAGATALLLGLSAGAIGLIRRKLS